MYDILNLGTRLKILLYMCTYSQNVGRDQVLKWDYLITTLIKDIFLNRCDTDRLLDQLS